MTIILNAVPTHRPVALARRGAVGVGRPLQLLDDVRVVLAVDIHVEAEVEKVVVVNGNQILVYKCPKLRLGSAVAGVGSSAGAKGG